MSLNYDNYVCCGTSDEDINAAIDRLPKYADYICNGASPPDGVLMQPALDILDGLVIEDQGE